jgi:hypothetical protein
MRQTFEFIFDDNIMSPNQLRDMYREAIRDLRDELLASSEGRKFYPPIYDEVMKIPRIDVPLDAGTLLEIRRRIEQKLAASRDATG